MATIHIGNAIRERLQEVGMTKAEFARRIHTSRQNVNDLLNRPHIDAGLLRQISLVLKTNFFTAYMEGLESDPLEGPMLPKGAGIGICIGVSSQEEILALIDLLREHGYQ